MNSIALNVIFIICDSAKEGMSAKQKPAEILIFKALSLKPIFVETYEDALKAIDSFRKEKGYIPSEQLIAYIRVWAGVSKKDLERFVHQLNLDQIEYHVYW